MNISSKSIEDEHQKRQHLIKFSIAKIMSSEIPRRTRDSAFTRYIPQTNKQNTTLKNNEISQYPMIAAQSLIKTKGHMIERYLVILY